MRLRAQEFGDNPIGLCQEGAGEDAAARQAKILQIA